MSIENTKSDPENKKKSRLWIFDLILISVLLLAAYFRLTGLFWGENQFLHPDERFLVWVGTDISPVSSLSEYFDTANSSLNPHNRGHGFYVYGTLPMFLARYIVEWIYGHSGFKEMTEVGRSLSAIADILTVVLVYLIAKRVYDKRVALIAALFSTAAVAQIQHSHFFTMDTFLVFFSFLAFYFAIRIVTDDKDWERGATEQSNDIKPDPSQQENNIDQPPGRKTRNPFHVFQIIHHPLLLPCLGFGIALGMAVASKLNAAPMALILPGALAFRLLELPPNKRERYLVQSILFLGLAALVSLVTFRLLQPYAFSGPDFLGIKPNPQWLANIQELRAQSSGDVDFPPAMQWARRPVWFSGKNLVLWGLGLPLGILAWFGFLWAGWQMLTCKDKKRSTLGRHALLWGWTAVYFTWQSLSQNPSMRYQLLVYPTLAIFAAWAIVEFYDKWKSRRNHIDQEDEGTDSTQANAINRDSNPLLRLLVILVATIVLISTIAYAFAFTQIYDRPITRIEASRWIYQNIPAAINLRIQTTEGITNQPLPFPYTFTITPGTPYVYNFQPKVEGELSEIYLPNVSDQLGGSEEKNLEITISSVASPEDSITSASVSDVFPTADASDNTGYTITFDQPITLDTENTYILSIKIPGEVSGIPLTGEITLRIQPFEGSSSGEAIDQVLSGTSMNLRHQAPFALDFSTDANGHLEQILIESAPLEVGFSVPQNIKLKLALLGSELEMLESDMTIQENSSDQGYWYSVNQPPALLKGQDYVLTLETEPTGLALSLTGKALANEGDWDDGLPLRLDGYDGFGGLYPLDLNFNMYWDDNPEKLERFLRILDESDFILISSSRQWGSLPRIPERYPMTTIYYRNLLGCPTSEEIERCYNLAEPGMFQGNLGFELTQVFRSDPVISPLRINDQFAEEAFTVYDHPKVFVFQKTDAYDSEQVRRILSTTDLHLIIDTRS
jgi:4-amino-4-deoxy-L-arabinose transferase-like glycosyltransferase